MSLIYDEVPQGTFYADGILTPEQAAAIRHAEDIGLQLAIEQADTIELLARKVSLRYVDIAAILIPDEAEEFPYVASKAVGIAVGLVISKNELEELTHTRRSLRLTERMQALGETAFLEHQRSASLKSREGRDGPDVEAMLLGRGRIPWSDQEKVRLAELLNDPAYEHQEGQHTGKPDYELIALELNITFHACEGIRYSNSVRSMRNQFYR